LLCLFGVAHAEEVRWNQVELNAEVTREVANDLMRASLYAEASDASAAVVADRLNRLTAEALAAAKGVAAVKASSGSANTYPVYDRAQKITGWRGRADVRLESKDTKAMASLIAKLQASLQLSGVSFAVSPEARRKVEDELMVEAVAAFRSRAEIATKALGGKGYRIRRVGLNAGFSSGPVPRPAMLRAAPMASSEVSTPVFEAGTSKVTVQAGGVVEVE
jgi:predicted secreted protein